MLISGVLPHQMDYIWPYVEKHIAAAMEYDIFGLGSDYIKDQVKNKKMQLWVIGDDLNTLSACVTEIEVKGNKKLCRVLLLAGKHYQDWIGELSDEIEEWAKYEGCFAVEVMGRKGWERIAPKYGYTFGHSNHIKVL